MAFAGNPRTQKRSGFSEKGHGRFRRAGALALAGVVAFGGFVATDAPEQAQAASNGYGLNLGAGWYGSYVSSDGTIVFCIEPGTIEPYGAQGGAYQTGTLPGYGPLSAWVGSWSGTINAAPLSGQPLSAINYLISTYGSNSDSVTAAAVARAIHMIRANADPGSGIAGWISGNDGELLTRPGGAAAIALSNTLVAEANTNGNPVPSTPATPPSAPVITTNANDAYSGTVSYGAGTRTLTITNGYFIVGGAQVTSYNITNGAAGSVQWVGLPPNYEDKYYTVTVDGTWEVGSNGWPAELIVYDPTVNFQQRLARGIGPINNQQSGTFQTQTFDPDTTWAPQLSSQVSTRSLQPGETASDNVIFSAQQGGGLYGWRYGVSNGNVRYAPITANGVLYGPFLQDPAWNPSNTVPSGAPVVGTATVTTSISQGPGSYAVPTNITVDEAGYYTWVWTIEWDDQLPGLRNPASLDDPALSENHLPFSDQFGASGETQIKPMNLSIQTNLSDNVVGMGQEFVDNVNIQVTNGGWLSTESGPASVVARGTIYHSDERPTQQSAVPTDATVLGTTYSTTARRGQIVSDPINTAVPFGTTGFVTVRWCILEEDQTPEVAELIDDSCDDYGVPSETAEITTPVVTTQAQPEGAEFGNIRDTAIVTGDLPDQSYNPQITFTAYLKPEVGQPKYDENWEPILDQNGDPVLWTEDEVSDPEAVCMAQPVAETEPVAAHIGTVGSPLVLAKSEGTVYWVERLIVTNPDNPNEQQIIHEGICGLPNETTEIVPPNVTTKAVEEAFPGDNIYDTAIVNGPLSDREEVRYEVTFEAYHRAEGTTTAVDETLCTVDTKVWESTEPIQVTGVGEYQSESWQVSSEHMGEILWVETLWRTVTDDDGNETVTELHRGNCGEAQEITKVVNPPLTPTDSGSNIALYAGLGSLLLVLAAGSVVVIRRRQNA